MTNKETVKFKVFVSWNKGQIRVSSCKYDILIIVLWHRFTKRINVFITYKMFSLPYEQRE